MRNSLGDYREKEEAPQTIPKGSPALMATSLKQVKEQGIYRDFFGNGVLFPPPPRMICQKKNKMKYGKR